jgi:hypothetical protein
MGYSRLALAAFFLAAHTASAKEALSYEWITGHGDGNASLVYGSPETGEDYVLSLFCSGPDKVTGLTVYMDIPGTKLGDPIVISLTGPTGEVSIPGKIATDEMSGFLFAEADGFKIKPVIGLLQKDGDVTAKTGSVLTKLPVAGRGKAVAEFAKNCPVD